MPADEPKPTHDARLGNWWRRTVQDSPTAVAVAFIVMGASGVLGLQAIGVIGAPGGHSEPPGLLVEPCAFHQFRIPKALWGTGVGDSYNCEGHRFEVLVGAPTAVLQSGLDLRFVDRSNGVQASGRCARVPYQAELVSFGEGPGRAMVSSQDTVFDCEPDQVEIGWRPVRIE